MKITCGVLCKYCKGTEIFTNDKGITRWGVRCQLTGGYPIRNYDSKAQAQLSIDEWCTGDGRRGCRPYLLKETGHSYNFSGDLLREFDAMEEATVAKQTYYCKCGKTFQKSSTAQDTGYRIDDYNERHECYGCPFVEQVTDGWGSTLTVKTHECRASMDKVNYTTTASMALDSDCVARVYTLNLPWLDHFINFYLDTPGCDRSMTDRDPDTLEMAFRNSSLLYGRRSYSFEFKKNKQGRAARKIVCEKFFDEKGKAYQLGCGPSDEKVQILQMIEFEKQTARDKVMQMEDEIFGVESDIAVVAPELPTPQEVSPIVTTEQRSITDVTAEIRFYKAQTVSNIIEIGKRLIEAKAMLEHGQWGEWLHNEVDFSHDSARRFMQLAEEYPNYAPVRNLSYSNLLALLAVPADERKDFIEATHVVDGEEKTVDEMTKRELQRVIKERDEVKQLLAVAQRDAEQQRIQANMRMDMEQAATCKLHDAEGKLMKLKDENRRQRIDIERFESKPIDVAVAQPTEKQMEEMRNQIRKEFAVDNINLAQDITPLNNAEIIFLDTITGAKAMLLGAIPYLNLKDISEKLEVCIAVTEQLLVELQCQKSKCGGLKTAD